MHRISYYTLLLLSTLIASNIAYFIEQPQLQLLDNSFRLSVEDDPDIEWVQFNVNINEEFLEFEKPQYTCTASTRGEGRWSCEFEIQLKDQDIVYTWLTIQHNHLTYRARKNPFSVRALKRGDQNYILTTTTAKWSSFDFGDVTTEQINKVCDSTLTELPNGGNICRNQLIFEDKFDEFNNEYWTNEIRIPSTRLESEFVIYNGSGTVNNGIFKITASLSDHGIKEPLDLGTRCTAKSNSECLFVPRLHHFLPPIISGRINSAKYFNFKYGRIEVKAKVPKGDWLFPIIALHSSNEEYGSAPLANGEMRVAFVRGNDDLKWNNVNIGGTRLFGGPIFSLVPNERHKFMSNITLAQVNGSSVDGINKHFGDKFHVYSLTWKPTELLLSVDGQEYGNIPINFKDSLNMPSWRNKAPNAPLDQMFYITLGLAAGGHSDFPENVQNKPWENTDPKALKEFYKHRNSFLGKWNQPSLEIDYVRVYAI